MGRSSAEEIDALKASVMEKNRLIEQQMSLINEQIDALSLMAGLQKQNHDLKAQIRDLEVCRTAAEAELAELRDRCGRLESFYRRVRVHPFIRLMKWFNDDI